MLRLLGTKSVLAASLLFMAIMMVICMKFVNPAIDGQNGASLLELQLAFDKELGLEIINRWGADGIAVYLRWGFTDYLYAVSYSLFLASLLAVQLFRTEKEGAPLLSLTPFLALAAGACDWLENILEYFFINNPLNFPAGLFFAHSLVALLKWAGIFTAITAIIYLLLQRSRRAG